MIGHAADAEARAHVRQQLRTYRADGRSWDWIVTVEARVLADYTADGVDGWCLSVGVRSYRIARRLAALELDSSLREMGIRP